MNLFLQLNSCPSLELPILDFFIICAINSPLHIGILACRGSCTQTEQQLSPPPLPWSHQTLVSFMLILGDINIEARVINI